MFGISRWLPAVFSYAGTHLLLSIRKLAADRQRRFSLDGVSTQVPSFVKPSPDTPEAIELQEFINWQTQGSSLLSPDTPVARRHDVERGPVAEFDRDEDRLRIPLARSRPENQRAPPPPPPRRNDAQPVSSEQGAASQDSAGGLPPLALGPPFSIQGIFARLARRWDWDWDWLKDWEHY
ncbi:hypothetical protein PHLCEN_2v7705 [Hermanssonia centrifuga]|uniref:Uncharacterized protein n=1 Tax=Hermanssonia centrifuga TaxID=98765 RepID=A0A2R6NVS8_9APHY|nr:hypothetical protein PHLCEN_2v7705 [Hermanssonia centrifuga]